jgi:hypothetical protein
VPAPGKYDDGEIGGMIGRETRSTRKKPAPMPLCLPQTPHTCPDTKPAAAVGSQRLTALATAGPLEPVTPRIAFWSVTPTSTCYIRGLFLPIVELLSQKFAFRLTLQRIPMKYYVLSDVEVLVLTLSEVPELELFKKYSNQTVARGSVVC